MTLGLLLVGHTAVARPRASGENGERRGGLGRSLGNGLRVPFLYLHEISKYILGVIGSIMTQLAS